MKIKTTPNIDMKQKNINKPKDEWYKKTLEKLVFASLNEQKKQRRWKIVFKLLFLFYFVISTILFILIFADKLSVDVGEHVAIVELKGLIAEEESASAKNIKAGLNDAFADDNTRAVILDINSPGGSPVQSSLIYQHIRRLKKQHPKIPIYAVASDVCASGSYYVASATDKIFANESSIIGSIGVRMDSFGAVEAIRKLGITRRLLTAGKNKATMDPFLPINPQKKQHIQNVLAQIHRQFIKDVKRGRGKRLKANGQTFTGLYWTGKTAKEQGLIDKIADKEYVLKNIIKVEKTKNFTPREDLISRIGERVEVTLKSLFFENSINVR
jgi:protease IV